MEKRLTFEYGRALVTMRIAFFAIAFGLLGSFLVLAPRFPLVPAAVFLTMLAAAMLVFAISPLVTQHWLTRSRLILRQGWYFRTILPLSDIESVVAADETTPLRAPVGIHRPLGQPVLYVTGGRSGLVILHLREPRRFWSSFGLEARQIVFDVDDRAGFLRAYEERRKLLAPVQADRAGPDLRD